MAKPKPKPKSPNYGSWVTIKPVPPWLHPIGMIDHDWDKVADEELSAIVAPNKAPNHDEA